MNLILESYFNSVSLFNLTFVRISDMNFCSKVERMVGFWFSTDQGREERDEVRKMRGKRK